MKNWKENRALACVVLAAAILGGTFGIGGAKLSSAARSVNEAYAQNIAGDLALRAAAAQNIIAEGEAALGADAAAIEEAVAGKAAEVSNQLNDAYLKINSQADGVKSYGRVVDLMLAYARKQAYSLTEEQ